MRIICFSQLEPESYPIRWSYVNSEGGFRAGMDMPSPSNQKANAGNDQSRLDQQNEDSFRQPVENFFTDEGAENHDRSERQPHRDAVGRQNRRASISEELGDVHHDCRESFSADEGAFDQTVGEEEGNHNGTDAS